jgi:hypothetical protein
MRGPKIVRSPTPLNPPEFTKDDIHFNKWLAGFIDGDGYFYLSTRETLNRNRKAALEIKQALWNNDILLLLKEKLGGNIYKKQGSTNVYYLRKREHLIPLVHKVNGHIRATSRTVQFKKLCDFYNITWIEPSICIEPDDQYFSGMFDADGSIVLSVAPNTNYPRMSLAAASKYEHDIRLFKYLFKGNIVLSKKEICYYWRIAGKEDVLFAQKYFGKTLKSNKLTRANLIPLFYELKEKRAYRDDSPQNKDWKKFILDWYNNGADIYRKDCEGVPYTEKARLEREMKKDLAHKNRDEE